MSENAVDRIMTIDEIREMVAGSQYNFLRKNEHRYSAS